MGAIYNNARHTRIFHPEERRADRNCMPIFARVRTAHEGETGWERIERDEQVKGKRPRTRTGVYSRGYGQREGRGAAGKEDTAEGFITRDLLLLPGGGGPFRNGQWQCIRRGVCLSDTCSSRTHTRTRAPVYDNPHTHTRARTLTYGAHHWDEPTSVHPVS